METVEFERIKKEFGKLLFWEQSLNMIRKIRKRPECWSVKFHNIVIVEDVTLPCEMTLDMLEQIENNITGEYEKQKRICDSIKSPYEQENR